MIVRWASILGLVLLAHAPACADTLADLPDAGYSADHYSKLWKKSPFAIATPDVAVASVDYELVGLAQFEGVTYVSLIDKQSQEHFVLASDKPVRNLTLVSISHNSSGALASIRRNGEILTLRQEEAPAPSASSIPINPALDGVPASAPPSSVGGMVRPAYLSPPTARVHRPHIIIPPRPKIQDQASGVTSAP